MKLILNRFTVLPTALLVFASRALGDTPPPFAAPPSQPAAAFPAPPSPETGFVDLSLHEALAEQAAASEAQAAASQAQTAVLYAQASSFPVAMPPEDGVLAPVIESLDRLNFNFGDGAPRTLVIRSGDLNPETQAHLEDDMRVMSRVLGNALRKRLGEGGAPRASGIDLVFAPGSGSSRSLYLEKHGALFLFGVRFPLIAPEPAPESEKPKEETDTSWEDAKRELYGRNPGWDFSKEMKVWFKGPEAQPYQAEKVEQLKTAVIEALKSASNIRGLKPEDSITVTILGTPGRDTVEVQKAIRVEAGRSKRIGGGDSVVVMNENARNPDIIDGRPAPSRSGSVMTFQVLKSVVDDYAKGSLTPERFASAVRINRYAADTSGWNSGWFGYGK